MKDLMGRAIWDYYYQENPEDLQTETSISELDDLPVSYLFRDYQEMNALEKNMAIIKKSYVQSISVSMWNMQSSQLKTALDGIVNIPGIQYAAILDKEKVYVESGTIAKNKTMKKVLKKTTSRKTGGIDKGPRRAQLLPS